MNITPKYRPGMLLEPGNYTVEVSAPGYHTLVQRIGHTDEPTEHRVVLSRVL